MHSLRSTDRPLRIEPVTTGLRGELRVPGDKSISHRAFLINALGTGHCRIQGALEAADVAASRALVQALGVRLQRDGADWVLHSGPLHAPAAVIDCGNSGTTMRLGAGVCVHQPGLAVLTGDASLQRRPMGRIVQPLTALGRDVQAAGGLAPLQIRSGTPRFGVVHSPISSAQVKSALLLSARDTGVEIHEPARSRDHTELQLRDMGADLTEADGLILKPGRWDAVDVEVPGDLSSAAFWLVAASIVPGSDVIFPGLGLNPTRTGVIDALRAMGADLHAELQPGFREPRGTVQVRAKELVGCAIEGELTLRAIDELPVLAVAAAFAKGETRIRDAGELRHKESDRIARVVAGLRAMGAEVDETPDGMTLAGGGLQGGGVIDCAGDHRLAMAFAVAGLASQQGVTLLHADVVETSYPGFFSDLDRLTGGPA